MPLVNRVPVVHHEQGVHNIQVVHHAPVVHHEQGVHNIQVVHHAPVVHIVPVVPVARSA